MPTTTLPALTIPDALAADLRDCFLSAQPFTPALPSTAVRLQHETDDIPSPRLVILPGNCKRISGMDGTARVSISLEYITAMDRVPPANHHLAAGLLENWLISLRTSKRRTTIATRIYQHDLYLLDPKHAIRAEEREQVTALTAEWVVTRIESTTV